MLVLNYMAEEFPASVLMWLVIFSVLKNYLGLKGLSKSHHLICIFIISIVCGVLRNYIYVGKDISLIVYMLVLPLVVSILIAILFANIKDIDFSAQKYTKFKIAAGLLLLTLIFDLFPTNEQGSIFPGKNIFSSKLTFYRCPTAMAANSCDSNCSEKDKLKMEFKVDVKQKLVFYSQFRDGVQVGSGNYENCKTFDQENWVCKSEFPGAIFEEKMSNGIFTSSSTIFPARVGGRLDLSYHCAK